jgi:hypothetical protein
LIDGACALKATLKKAHTRWRTISHTGRFVVLGLVLLLLLGRLMLPYAVQHYVNGKLDQHPEYGGHIGNVRIQLVRGAYAIQHLDITKKSGKVPVPFLSARRVDFSVDWSEVLRGALVSEIHVQQGRFNFVKGPTKEQSQTEVERSWVAILEDLFPFKINRCEVRQGEVWYHDFHSKPEVHIWVTNLLLIATNLTNTRELKEELPAALRLRGTTIGEGSLSVSLRLNPLAEKPTFDLAASVTNLDVTALNPFLRAYTKADAQRGRLHVFTEIAAADGRFEGYIKPLAEDLEVLSAEDRNVLEVVWEAIVAVVVQGFKNHPRDQFGTKIPFSGSLDNPDVAVWETIVNVLRNAFVKALPANIEGAISPADVREGKPGMKEKRK